jgi:glycerophosphoryl diester phosphodiesterase
VTNNPFAGRPLIIGHRGAAGPENTLPGFQHAVELGVDAVELDVHQCTGQLMVIHDDTLDRTTSGTGPVAGASLEDLQLLDAGNGARIPTLPEVFELLPQTVGVNVELKGKNTANLLAELIPDYPDRSILISSFDHAALREFQSLRPDDSVAPLFARWRGDAISIATEFGSSYINLSRKLIDSGRIKEILALGLQVLVYTVNDLEEARRLFEIGVTGFFTDRPDLVSRAALKV